MQTFLKYTIIAIAAVLISSCSMSEKNDGGSIDSGKAGSLARFTISGNYLYTVDPSFLHTVDITDIEHPVETSSQSLGFYTETIYPYQNSLLLGTETGMFVFDLTIPAVPQQRTYFQHIRSCDPVVAQNGFAYITLNTGNQRCFNGMNELQIVDISNLDYPQLIGTKAMNRPLGLDINNDTLYVCDEGLRILNVSNKQYPTELAFASLQANDVIYQNGNIIVISDNGLFQYKFNSAGLNLISSIPIEN